MTKKISSKVTDSLPSELLFYKAHFNKVLDEKIKLGEELFNRQVHTPEDLKKNKNDYNTWTNENSEYLKKVFNTEQNEYTRNYDDADAFFFGLNGLRNTPLDSLKGLKDKIIYKISILKRIRATTDSIKNLLPDTSIRMVI